MKKLSFFLMAMILCFSAGLRAEEVTETIAMKKFGGLTSTSYENVTRTGTSDLGTEMVAYAFNPNTGQVRGNKTTIAGASVTSSDDSMNWSLYNTQAMPGAIKSITVTHTATGAKFQNSMYVALGTTNQGGVTTVTGAQQHTSSTSSSFTFKIDETQGYTYFKLLSNAKFTSGSVSGVVVTVTYVTGEENPDVTKYTVTTNVNDEAMGTVTGAGEYAEGKTATLTANPNAGYKFVNWSNGETANPLKLTVTENVEITANFAAIPPMTCAEAAATASGETVVLNPFDVVYVVKDAGYIYIKDESGVNLIYDFNLDDKLKAGDHVEGFVGTSSPYNGLPELKSSVSYSDLTVTSGTAPEPTLFTAAPTKDDVNKYVKFENVTLTANATFTTSSATNATMVVNGTNVTLRNNFKLAATLSADKAYNIVGFAAIYNSTIQVYFLSAEEYVAPVVNHTITVAANPAEAGTVTGGGEYEETDEITVKAVANEGYEFVCWTEGADTVSTEAEYGFVVLADRNLVANFKVAEPEYQVIEDEITNFVFDTESWPMVCYGGPSEEYAIEVYLVLTEAADGTLSYEDCSVSINGTDATFIEGTLSDLDVYAPSADAVLRVQWNGEFYELRLAMSAAAAPVEPITIEINNATVAVEEHSMGFGDEVYYVLSMDATWSDGETTYPVSLETTEFDQTKDSQEVVATITVGGWGDDDPWLGSAEGEVTITVVNNVVTVAGLLENPYAWPAPVAFDFTISGTLPADGPATALDNIDTTVAPVKAIENGQLIVIKNGVKYNALGQEIK